MTLLLEAVVPRFRVRLSEATKRSGFVKRLGNGRVRIKIIEPGQGSSGFYTPEVLAAAASAGMFDNVPIKRDHPDAETGKRPDMPDIDLTVGYIEPGARYLHSGPKGAGIYGVAVILEPYRRMVYSLVDTPFGLSIHADGDLEREGDTTSRVVAITKVYSVDIVVRPGAGGSIVEILESERLSPIGTEEVMRRRLFEDRSGNQYLHLGNIYEDGDGIYDDGLDEDDLDEMRHGGLRRVGERVRGAASSARERGRSAARSARERGRSAASNPRARMAGAAAGGAAVGAAAGRGSRRESLAEADDDDIYEDDDGNRFLFLGNINEDLEEDDELQEISPGLRMRARAERMKRRARKLPADMAAEGRTAAAKFRNMKTGTKMGMAAAGAGAAGMAAGSRRKESARDEDIYEDADGNQYVMVGNIHEDDEQELDLAQIEESIADIYESISEMRDGPERRRRLAEAANLATIGSYGSRRLIEQLAVQYADNPRDAVRLGRVIGQAIREDRTARGAHWSTQENARWDDSPALVGAGAWASGGGGNAGLDESLNEGFNTDFMDGLFR